MPSYTQYHATTRRRLVVWFAALAVILTGLAFTAATRPLGAQTTTTTFSYAGATVELKNQAGTFNPDPCSWVIWTVTAPATDATKAGGQMAVRWLDANGTQISTQDAALNLTTGNTRELAWVANAVRLTGTITGDNGQTSTDFALDRCQPDAVTTTSSTSSTSSTTAPPQVRELKFDTYTVRVNSNCKTATFTATNSAGGTWTLAGEITFGGVFRPVTWSNTTPSQTFNWDPTAESAVMRFTDAAGQTHALTFKRCQDPSSVTSDDGSSTTGWLWGGAAGGAGALMVGAAVVGYRRRPQH